METKSKSETQTAVSRAFGTLERTDEKDDDDFTSETPRRIPSATEKNTLQESIEIKITEIIGIPLATG